MVVGGAAHVGGKGAWARKEEERRKGGKGDESPEQLPHMRQFKRCCTERSTAGLLPFCAMLMRSAQRRRVGNRQGVSVCV